MNCKNAKNLITLSLYGELDEKGRHALERHLRECPACSADREYTRKVFELLDEYRPAPASEPNWEGSWQKIQSGITGPRSKGPAPAVPGWRWVYAGAAVIAVLVIGIAIGKYWLSPHPTPIQKAASAALSPGASPPTLSSHLEDIKPILLDYAHYSPADQGTKKILVDEKTVRGLLLQNLLLKRILAEKDPAAAELLDDLDLVLKEIVNQPSQDQKNPAEIKDLIATRGILFKMEILKTL